MTRSLPGSRKVFAVAMFGLALGLPLGIARGMGIDRDSINAAQIFLMLLPPLLAFSLLGLEALFLRSARFVSLAGSAIGALLAVGIPFGVAWFRMSHYRGGDADIGTGLILLGVPLYLIAGMTAGWHLGDAFFPPRD